MPNAWLIIVEAALPGSLMLREMKSLTAAVCKDILHYRVMHNPLYITQEMVLAIT